jgi:hypothetical protein
VSEVSAVSSPERFIEAKVYLSHVTALFRPGSTVREHIAMSKEMARAGDLEDWDDEELKLLIDECHFTLADQSARFDQVRTTSQILMPLAFALVALYGTQLTRLVDFSPLSTRLGLIVLWVTGCASSLLAGLGSAAILSVRARFGRVLPTLVSQSERPILRAVAKGYVGQAATGENTVATRLTLVRDAVFLLTLGGSLQLVLWVSVSVGT